jgi:hypothetical protein
VPFGCVSFARSSLSSADGDGGKRPRRAAVAVARSPPSLALALYLLSLRPTEDDGSAPISSCRGRGGELWEGRGARAGKRRSMCDLCVCAGARALMVREGKRRVQ